MWVVIVRVRKKFDGHRMGLDGVDGGLHIHYINEGYTHELCWL